MATRVRGWRAEWIVWAMIVVYIAYFGVLTVQQHNAFQTTAFDLGNVDQAVWNTRHGRPLAMTNIEGLTNRLGTHVEPILLPISLLYFVWSDPRALLLLQTLVVALGAWPVYLLARRSLRKQQSEITENQEKGDAARQRWALVLPLVFAFVYLMYPALQSANAFDFHAVSLAPTFFLFALCFLETERWGSYALFAVLTMSCKEDMPLLVAMLGVYALIVRRRWVAGLVTIGVAAAWFLVAVGWVMPRFDTGGASPLASRYAYLGDNPLQMAVTLVTQPGLVLEQLRAAGALTYVRDALTPVAFLSLLAPQVLMLALPPLAVNLLSTDGFMHQLEGFHYGVTIVAPAVVAAAYGAAWLIRRFPRARSLSWLLAAAVLIATLAYHHVRGYTPLAADWAGSWPSVTDHHRLGQEIASSIPDGASLAALPHPNPHASQRQQLSMIDRVENGLPAPLHDAAYVWVDVTNGWPLHPNDLKAGVENLLAGDYGVEQAIDGWLLLRRGASGTSLPDGFYGFARTTDPEPQYPMRLQFLIGGEPALESLGFDLEHDSELGTHSLTLYWRALKALPPGLALYPFFLDETAGQILEDTTQRPMIATVWYPPEAWRVGEVVQTSTLPWDVGDTFSVGLGVTAGSDWGQIEQRLPIRVESSGLVVRLFDGNTWARLLGVEKGQPIEESRDYSAPSPKHSLDTSFGRQIRLLGYDLDCNSRKDTCDLTLYWQAQQTMATSYTVFAQLLDTAGTVASQVDAVPRGGDYPTIWWLPGEVVSDPLLLMLPAGGTGHRLIVGLYDPATGDRLPVSPTGDDHVQLTTIQP